MKNVDNLPTASLRDSNSMRLLDALSLADSNNSTPDISNATRLQIAKLKASYNLPTDLIVDYHPNKETILLQKKPNKGRLAELSDGKAPTLSLVSLAFGHVTAIELVNLYITDLFQYTEQQQGVTDDRIYECATIIVDGFYYLNLLELLLFFAECKTCQYGKFYGTTGPSQLTAMLASYCNARSQSMSALYNRESTERVRANTSTNEFKEYLSLKTRALKGDQQAQQEINNLINHKP